MKTWNWAQKTILVEVLTLVGLSQKNWDSNDSRDRGPEIDSDDAKSWGVDRLTDWSSDGVGDKEVEDETSRGIA